MGKRTPDLAFWVFAIAAAVGTGLATEPFGFWMLVPVAVAIPGLFIAAAWRREGRRSFGTAPQAIPNVALIALPTVLASSTISRTASIYATLVVGLAIFGMRRNPTSRMELAWPCAILPAIGLFIVLRPNYPNTAFSVLVFAMGCIVIARAVYISSSASSALTSLIDGVGVYLVASMAFWVVGVEGTQDRTAGLENSLTGGDRAFFPLSGSLAATPSMAAVYLAAVTPILLTQRRYRILRLFAAAIAISIFVLSDTRSSLLGALFLAGGVLMAPRMFRMAAPWLVGAALAIPFVYGSVKDSIGQLVLAASSYVPWLVRPREDPATLNGRDYIWTQSLDFYGHRIGWVDQIFGFGSYGHTASGASASYNSSFSGFGDRRLVTPHSSMLQLLFDGGWLAASILAVTAIYMAVVLSRRTTPIDLAGLTMLVTLSVVGSTEVALSPGHSQPTWWIALALSIIVFSRDWRPEAAVDTNPAHITHAHTARPPGAAPIANETPK